MRVRSCATSTTTTFIGLVVPDARRMSDNRIRGYRMNGEKSLAEKILDEMSVRYAKDGIKLSDVVDMSDNDDEDDLSDDEAD